jgi:hypothetical protein
MYQIRSVKVVRHLAMRGTRWSLHVSWEAESSYYTEKPAQTAIIANGTRGVMQRSVCPSSEQRHILDVPCSGGTASCCVVIALSVQPSVFAEIGWRLRRCDGTRCQMFRVSPRRSETVSINTFNYIFGESEPWKCGLDDRGSISGRGRHFCLSDTSRSIQ